MQEYESTPRRILTAVALFLLTQPACAWGPEGHRVVGLLADMQVTPAARARLQEIIGSSDPAVMAETCNWPDQYRATADGAWSGPQHYINVPRGAEYYLRGRDCPEGACSAEAIKKYAGALGDEALPMETRRQAWGWVCHLAGDIHQPMHNGYREDRGGNDFDLTFKQREMNLHEFWDRALIEQNYPDWTLLAGDLAHELTPADKIGWDPEDVDTWIVESHELVKRYGYPDSAQFTQEQAAQRWLLARSRLALAGTRLAALVNEVLGD